MATETTQTGNITITNINVHFSKIYTVHEGGNTVYTNLFSHPLYYLQNTYSTSDDTVFTRDCAKALLYLHSLPFSYEELLVIPPKLNSFFNGVSTPYSTRGGIEGLPHGYVLLIGGLIWRKNYTITKGIDPIRFSSLSGVKLYNAPDGVDPLFIKVDGHYVFGCEKSDLSQKYYNLGYNDMIDLGTSRPTAETKLVDYFLSFVKNDFQKIKKYCELTIKDISGHSSDSSYPTTTTNGATYNGSQSTSMAQISGNTKYMTYDNLLALTETLNESENKTVNDTINILSGKKSIVKDGLTYATRTEFTVNNFTGNYVFGYPIQHNLLATYFSETNKIKEIFINLFFNTILVSTMPVLNKAHGIDKQALMAYYTGYTKIINFYGDKNPQKSNNIVVDDDGNDRDMKCAIYLALKNLWDRWLCGFYNQKPDKTHLNEPNGEDYFKVANFYCKNFYFIDSFYTNIYDKLRLNCTELLNQYNNSNVKDKLLGKTVVNHLGSVAAVHRCMMFNFPDVVNFTESEDGPNMVDSMGEMFRPMAANRVDIPEHSNKFTIIYTHPANKLDTIDRNKFVPDSFDIWSYDSKTAIAPAIFHGSTGSVDRSDADVMGTNSRMAYKVPAFGIAYSRQNNSFWKNIDVSMDNFSVTEQAIRAEAYIAEKGNSSKKNICFYGQDVYSLYQAYSYLVTVETLGNSQIQPLMYFQLMNIPMFRGTYMIIKVEHSISQGQMTTRFTGMKMSKVQAPFTTAWFTVKSDETSGKPKRDQDKSDNGETIPTIDGGAIDIEDNRLSRAINTYINTEGMLCDDFVQKVYGFKELNVKINKNLRS